MPKKRDKGKPSTRQRKKKPSENAFVCRLDWLTWLENNNRSPLSLTNTLPQFMRYDIVDCHWQWIWNMCLACCYCLCLHSTFTAQRFVPPFLTALLQTPTAFPAATGSFFLPHSSHKEVKKGEITLSWGLWQAQSLAGYDILLDAGNCKLIFVCGLLSESKACVPPLLCFCLHSELKLTKQQEEKFLHLAQGSQEKVINFVMYFSGASLDKVMITAQTPRQISSLSTEKKDTTQQMT